MTITQDDIWLEMNSRMPADDRKRRDESREAILDLIYASCANLEEISDSEWDNWVEDQKALVNEYFRLRDSVAPRLRGSEHGYQDDGVKSNQELDTAILDLEAVANEISAKISVDGLDLNELERWREIDPRWDVMRARDRLRWRSRLPQSDPRIDELLYQYGIWDREVHDRQLRLMPRMGVWRLILTALFDPGEIQFMQGRIADVAKAEGMRDGLRLALWAFDYAPENAELSDGKTDIPITQLGTGFWRSGKETP
ncbi:hypothetical protein [Tabrizicola sp.]|uniref:hypothetical protein n=1 Tax=Tabrizicola sp. TaxID=2005166 RepID=UPI0035B35965